MMTNEGILVHILRNGEGSVMVRVCVMLIGVEREEGLGSDKGANALCWTKA